MYNYEWEDLYEDYAIGGPFDPVEDYFYLYEVIKSDVQKMLSRWMRPVMYGECYAVKDVDMEEVGEEDFVMETVFKFPKNTKKDFDREDQEDAIEQMRPWLPKKGKLENFKIQYISRDTGEDEELKKKWEKMLDKPSKPCTGNLSDFKFDIVRAGKRDLEYKPTETLKPEEDEHAGQVYNEYLGKWVWL